MIIGAGTGPAGPAMVRPFSAVYAFDFCVVSFPDPAGYVHKCARIRLTFGTAKLPVEEMVTSSLKLKCRERVS